MGADPFGYTLILHPGSDHLYFFFFQAEDGIRDLTVTGVQTCALPISGLATVQAVEAVKEADVIRNCDGCGTGLLHFAPANADIAPLESVEEVIRLARSGRNVTVLFPGNPYAFSSGSEIADRLDRAGVDFEAVPRPVVELAAPGVGGIPPPIGGPSGAVGVGPVTRA